MQIYYWVKNVVVAGGKFIAEEYLGDVVLR
jgi:hypothetical protein